MFGDNGVFGQASEAKLKTDIANWQERLEMAKSPVFIEGLGTFNPDKYFDYIQQQGIINNKDTDVIDNGDGTYDVTVKPGYVFLVTLTPTPENPTDAEIEYIGQAGKIAPIIKRLDVSATSTSITGKAVVARLGTNGTVKYYYKSTSADDSTYTEITNINEVTGATQSTGITAGESYTIKVVAKNDVGEVELAKEITATKIPVESITLNKTEETVAVGKTVALTATIKPDDATNKNITWESSNTSIATVSDNGLVTGKTVGTATITVKSTDGSEKSATCIVTVKSVSLNKTTTTIEKGKTETLVATVLPTNATNKNVTWSSSNTSIATVSSTGVVSGIANGTATITVSTTDTNKATASCKVTVKEFTVADIVGQTQTSNRTVKDEYGNEVVVPGGFKVVANGTSDVTYSYANGKPCVQDGIVIQDGEGNQFVWIPVGNIKNKDNTTTLITLGRYTFIKNDIPRLQQFATSYSRIITIGSYYQEKISDDGNTAAKSLSTFVSKTINNGGYYLGRYEASKGVDGKVNSQVGQIPWVDITQPNAATEARRMYSSSYVDSDLINSYSWDTAIVFIEKYSAYSQYADKPSVNTAKKNTGRSGDKVCNIYDMASNCYEWSTEHSLELNSNQIYPCVYRGGGYGYQGDTTSLRMQGYGGTSFKSPNVSFRPLLYLK